MTCENELVLKNQTLGLSVMHAQDGSVQLTINVSNKHVAALSILTELLAQSAKKADEAVIHAQETRESEAFESKLVRSKIKRSERMAMNIIKRTKSYDLATKATGLNRSSIKALIKKDMKNQEQMFRAARNKHLYYMHNILGWSLRDCAARYALNHNTVATIIDKTPLINTMFRVDMLPEYTPDFKIPNLTRKKKT